MLESIKIYLRKRNFGIMARKVAPLEKKILKSKSEGDKYRGICAL